MANTNTVYTIFESTIYVGAGFVSLSFVGVAVKETEKAIQLQPCDYDGNIVGEHTVWIPKKALTKIEHSEETNHTTSTLAKWFDYNNYQSWFFDRYMGTTYNKYLAG